MENNSASLGSATIELKVPCPPTCHWHGTGVSHRMHYAKTKVDVVTVEEAVRRLGLEGKVTFAHETDKKIPVLFKPRVESGDYVYSTTSARKSENGMWVDKNIGHTIDKVSDGSLKWVVWT